MTASSVVSATGNRTVARPIANLGNTCYMNAVLQALAHAPDLCLAMDCEPHQETCPIAAGRRSRSPTVSPETVQSTRKSQRRKSPVQTDDFCALYEIESHLRNAHNKEDEKPVAPSSFVHGFIDHVAPWFKLGMQEDSHEFLRLLIDAMQKSARRSRKNKENVDADKPDAERDVEYPFYLFRGTVESQVTCEHCKAKSSTLDPIEDIGLEASSSVEGYAPPISTRGTRGSRNASPVPVALADVQQAFKRFARVEELDSGYKCEKCGQVGRATKQSRLASIPPILTLHLKRFRYGGDGRVGTVRRGRSSELSQLAGGKSGSAKIEGHIKFEVFFDLHPYLTEDLQKEHKNMYCRLFAVVVHAGKNSHSGHYIAYVRNIAVNEWWKMDDGRVTAAPESEVLQAEAYMLFYRVVQHPVSLRLESMLQRKQEEKAKETIQVNKCPTQVPDSSEESEQGRRGSKKRPLSPEAGIEWARKKTTIPLSLIREVQSVVAEDVSWSPDFVKLLSSSVKDGSVPKLSISDDDVIGGTENIRSKLTNVFYKLHSHAPDFWVQETSQSPEKIVAVVEPEDADLL